MLQSKLRHKGTLTYERGCTSGLVRVTRGRKVVASEIKIIPPHLLFCFFFHFLKIKEKNTRARKFPQGKDGQSFPWGNPQARAFFFSPCRYSRLGGNWCPSFLLQIKTQSGQDPFRPSGQVLNVDAGNRTPA